MRITQKTQVKVPEVQLNKGAVKTMQSGDVFRAKVIAIHTEAILLKLTDGSNLRAQVSNPERFVEGESMDFLVKESDVSKVPLVETLTADKLSEAVKDVLVKTGLKASPSHVEAYKVLESLGIEISSENIEKLVKNTSYVSKISDALVKLAALEVEANDERVRDGDVQTSDKNIRPSVNGLKATVIKELAGILKSESPDVLKEMPLKDVVLKLLASDYELKADESPLAETDKEVIKRALGPALSSIKPLMPC